MDYIGRLRLPLHRMPPMPLGRLRYLQASLFVYCLCLIRILESTPMPLKRERERESMDGREEERVSGKREKDHDLHLETSDTDM